MTPQQKKALAAAKDYLDKARWKIDSVRFDETLISDTEYCKLGEIHTMLCEATDKLYSAVL